MSKPPAPDQKSLVGYTIGKCKLLRICGRGAMGTVYKGMHSGLDIEVAVKVLPPHLANNSNLVERFLREAKLAARLNHANTVRVYDVGEESGYNYLVMEFIEGTDALELIKKHGRQEAAVVADIGAGAARALEHAHGSDVVHRDIKPANLMLPDSGGVKVADFGLARALSSESGLTMTGAIMGTPDYMAPEQAQGEQVGPLADIYSLGATLYHLFVGRPPFQGGSPMAVALQHVTNRVVVPEEMVKDETSQALTRVIHELTQKDPRKRPSNLDQIAERLQKIARNNKRTQKLLSEGATLFATAGLKLDAQAINKAKEEEAADALDKGRVQSPHLEKLRQAAEKARSGMHAALPDPAPRAQPKEVSAEMAELTGDMVREARARSRRSSGQIKALGSDSERLRRNSNPELSPHREPRPTSNTSSRRSRIVQNPELDDQAWQSYAAKSFPTFERKSIVEGGVPAELVRERDSGVRSASSVSGAAPAVDFSVPSTGLRDWTPPKPRRSGGTISLLVALLIVAGVAASIWYFFLRKPDDSGGSGQGTHVAGLNMQVIKAHANGTSISVIAPQTGGSGFYTGGEDGSIKRWEAGSVTPTKEVKLAGGKVTVLVTRSSGARLVVGTSDGVVMILDANTLAITSGMEMRVEGEVTAIASIGDRLYVGDSHGRLNTGKARFQVGQEGERVAAVVLQAGDLWAVAGTTVARYKLDDYGNLSEFSKFPNSGGQIYSLVSLDGRLFGIVNDEVRKMGPEGPAGAGFKVRKGIRVLGITHDRRHLVAVDDTGAVLLDPEKLTAVATAPIESGVTVTAIGCPPQAGRFYLGTRSGDLLQFTFQ